MEDPAQDNESGLQTFGRDSRKYEFLDNAEGSLAYGFTVVDSSKSTASSPN